MKKSVIATGAASLALAAMPVVGMFAYNPVNQSGTVTDHLTVNIPASCTIKNENSPNGGNNETQDNPTLNNYYYVEMANGEFRDRIGVNEWDDRTGEPGEDMTATNTISVSCNTAKGDGSAADPAGWALTAKGAGAAGYETDLKHKTTTDVIPAGVATADSTDSAWSYKVTMGNVAATEQAAYNTDYVPAGQQPSYKAITAGETEIAKGSGSFAAGFTMEYAVYVDADQPQGTYEGAVVYTLYNPAA